MRSNCFFPVSFQVTTGTQAAPVVTNITLEASDFNSTAAATTDELVAAINNDLGIAGSAQNVGGRLVMQSNLGGESSQLGLANSGAGTVLTDLNLSTVMANGRENAVKVSVEGSYEGAGNNQFTFEPEIDGVIGQTEDLRVRVLDQDGNLGHVGYQVDR